MNPLTRLLGWNKPKPVEPARVEQVVAANDDKARPVRAPVYREATVMYDSGYKRRGIVLDYTHNGVRVRFPTTERLPETVLLQAKAVGLEGMAEVVWQRGAEAGLQLADEP